MNRKKISRYKRRTLPPRLLQWKKTNPWFGNDPEKTWHAILIHNELVASGIQAGSDKYYRELDVRLNDPGPKLTESKIALAKELGIAPYLGIKE